MAGKGGCAKTLKRREIGLRPLEDRGPYGLPTSKSFKCADSHLKNGGLVSTFIYAAHILRRAE